MSQATASARRSPASRSSAASPPIGPHARRLVLDRAERDRRVLRAAPDQHVLDAELVEDRAPAIDERHLAGAQEPLGRAAHARRGPADEDPGQDCSVARHASYLAAQAEAVDEVFPSLPAWVARSSAAEGP
ncbi:MAG: hypothetical protein M5U28_40550 [Sandaracinaceae bacterium]|nr:hypothetical protein [Sandaracinaceae bacterium]